MAVGSTPTRITIITNEKGLFMAKWLHFIIGILFLSLVSGCGSNIFDGLVTEDTNNVEALLDNAVTTEDFQQAITVIDEQLQDSTITDSEKAELLVNKGEAIIGAKDLPTQLDFLTVVNDMTSARSSASNDPVNMINKVDELFGESNPEDLVNSAKAFNEAEALTASSDVKLTGTQQINKGMVNGMAAIANLQTEFDVDSQGNATKKDSDKSMLQALESALYPSGTADTSNSTITFANESLNSLNEAGIFEEDQTEEVSLLKDAVLELDELYKKKAACTTGQACEATIDNSTVDITTEQQFENAILDQFRGISG